jgi:hypothetical protein
VDNLSSVEISIIEESKKNRMIRTYTLIDDSGNSTELIIEIQHAGKEIKAEVTGLKYNNQPVSLPENQLKIEYLVEENDIKKLNQSLLIGDIQIHMIYHRTKDYTQFIVDGKEENKQGVFIVYLQTCKGAFHYTLEKVCID